MWAAVHATGTIDLKFSHDNQDLQKYCATLSEILLPFSIHIQEYDCILSQDSALVHTSRLTTT